jgi:predicted N-acyltransferase
MKSLNWSSQQRLWGRHWGRVAGHVALRAMSDTTFDYIIIGGGTAGACFATA